MDNYRPQLFLRTADITAGLHWPEGTPDAAEKMVMPGDNVEMVCELVHDVAAEVGTRFTLREGGKTSEHYIQSSRTTILTTALSRNRYCYEALLGDLDHLCHVDPPRLFHRPFARRHDVKVDIACQC